MTVLVLVSWPLREQVSPHEIIGPKLSSNMSPFKCFCCGLISDDLSKVKVHMKLAHNVKVEDDDFYTEKLVCSFCPYTRRNMANFQEHMIKEHKKDKWNWSLEVKAVQFCDECEIEFPKKTMLRKHL